MKEWTRIQKIFEYGYYGWLCRTERRYLYDSASDPGACKVAVHLMTRFNRWMVGYSKEDAAELSKMAEETIKERLKSHGCDCKDCKKITPFLSSVYRERKPILMSFADFKTLCLQTDPPECVE